MQDFTIQFTYPWLLLLLILGIGVALIPFFRIEKKYRYTRNRVCSVVLHCITITLAILALAGMNFSYNVPNDKNEIILLVDVSDSGEDETDARDEFVRTVLTDGQYDNYKIGLVTFGFDQKYAVPLTTDVNGIFERYLVAEQPDTGATDIAAALTYTSGLFENPSTGKIVLVTDGKETDEEAVNVIRSVAAQGIKVDVAQITTNPKSSDLQILEVKMPDYHVGTGQECTLSVTLKSDVDMFVKLSLTDNGDSDDKTGVYGVDIKKGTQTVNLKHVFKDKDLHVLSVKAESNTDVLDKNNEYITYYYLEELNKVLILDRYNDSEALEGILSQDGLFDVTVKNVLDDDMPDSVNALREYDQVILNNVANKDFPDKFTEVLYSYVHDYGGGLFTVGGKDDGGNANAYNRDDMYNEAYGALYRQMLPVETINYTPPVGVMVIIDRSGSMSSLMDDGTSYLDWAKAGAASCLDALTERDYFGLMTLESDYNVLLDLTPVPQRAKILSAIQNSIDSTAGGTVFSSAIDRAGLALRNLKSVDRRHIVIVTDGAPGDSEEKYLPIVENYYKNDGITVSVVGIGIAKDSPTAEKMSIITETGHGRPHFVTSSLDLVREMRDDLNAPAIKEINYEEFFPVVYDRTSPLLNGIEVTETESRLRLTTSLDGFYGVKKRENSEVVLVGEYDVPIYAQWKYGKGMVGSFMCDLSGEWSMNFMYDANGQKFIYNAINNLMPVESIRSKEIETTLKSENYINRLSVLTDLQDGERIKGVISFESDSGLTEISINEITAGENLGDLPCYVTLALDASNNYSRCHFVAKQSGVYTIRLVKCNADGSEIEGSESVIYKEFSYSAEYSSVDEAAAVEFEEKLKTVVERGNGKMIENLDDPVEIFEGFIVKLARSFDPRIALMIAVIVLFLLDLIVRKFKFKWPHELIREHREKKNDKKQNNS